jgi:hypothetical protein
MRYFKSSYLGVAGLIGLAMVLLLAPKLRLQSPNAALLIRTTLENPLMPRLGVFKVYSHAKARRDQLSKLRTHK